jgi:hypothetical protein
MSLSAWGAVGPDDVKDAACLRKDIRGGPPQESQSSLSNLQLYRCPSPTSSLVHIPIILLRSPVLLHS